MDRRKLKYTNKYVRSMPNKVKRDNASGDLIARKRLKYEKVFLRARDMHVLFDQQDFRLQHPEDETK